jgi:hypothetical protein
MNQPTDIFYLQRSVDKQKKFLLYIETESKQLYKIYKFI